MKNKKTNKTLFSRKLYIEGIRQLDTLGIICLIINLIIGIIIPVGNYLSSKTTYDEILASSSSISNFTPQSLDAYEIMSYLALFFLIFTPLMTLSLFKFLNNRDECDFYHSIPHTKKCLFLSFASAEFTWLLLDLTIVTSVSAILYKAFSKYVVVDFSQIFTYSINIFIICFLVASFMMLAFSISGNIMTALLTFAIIFFLPRIIIIAYQRLMASVIPYMYNSFPEILDTRNNLLFGYGAGIFNGQLYSQLYTFTFSSLYTFVVAAVGFGLAYLAFYKRKSETAGTSMSNRLMQTIFRTVFVLAICTIPITLLFTEHIYKDVSNVSYGNNSMTVFYVVISYIAALGALFLYELLTTKNAKKALKAFRSIPVLIVLNIVLYGGLLLSFNHYINLRMNVDDIEYVQFSYEDNSYYYDSNDYFQYSISAYKYKSENTITSLCDAFNNYADEYKAYLNGDRDTFNDYLYSSLDTLTFQTKHKKYNLAFDLSDSLMSELTSTTEYLESAKSVYADIPDLSNIKSAELYCHGNINLDYSQTKELYNCLKEELNEVDIDKWISLIKNSDYSNESIYLSFYMDTQRFSLTLPITDVTPKTLNKLISLYDKSVSSVEIFKKDYETFVNSDDAVEKELYISSIGDTPSAYPALQNSLNTAIYISDDGSLSTNNKEFLSLLLDNIQPLSDYDGVKNKAICIIASSYLDKEDYNNYTSTSVNYAFVVSNEIYSKLIQLQ